jgi:hypothetical protein
MWNFLVLPYRDDALIRQLFHLGEVARTYFSAESKIPGLLASCNPPKTPRKETGEYLGGSGIPSLAEAKIYDYNVVTPYAAFPVMIDDLKTGLAWYYTMIKGPRMLGPYGSTEAITSDGSNIAPVLTWDAKILPVLALVEPDLNRGMRDALKKYGKYNDFLKLVGTKYRSVFGDTSLLQGSQLKLQLPTASIPSSVPDFESSKKPTSINLLADPTFIGTGMLYKSLSFNENPSSNEARMTLPQEMGSVLMKTRHLQASDFSFISFMIRTSKKCNFFLEFKNPQDELLTEEKICITLPDTKKIFQQYSINYQYLLKNPTDLFALIGFSNTDSTLEFKQIDITRQKPAQSLLFDYDGRRYTYKKVKNIYRGKNLIRRVNFISGGEILFDQDDTVKLDTSNGWIWGLLPKDLKILTFKTEPALLLTYKAPDLASVSIQLQRSRKDASPLELLEPRVLRVDLPPSPSSVTKLRFSLPMKIWARQQAYEVDVFVLADPNGSLEIFDIQFETQ